MSNGVSEIIGQAVFGDGSKAAVYRALRPLWCASCGGVVPEGAMFTRERQAGQGLRLWPRCQACAPFALETDEQRTRSPLLQALLTPAEQEQTPTASHSKKATNNEQQEVKDKQKKTAEAMRQRLGPALERARRSRSGNR